MSVEYVRLNGPDRTDEYAIRRETCHRLRGILGIERFIPLTAVSEELITTRPDPFRLKIPKISERFRGDPAYRSYNATDRLLNR